METIIDLTLDNLDQEHICCALSGGTNDGGVAAKKAWLRERLQEGLRFKKLNIRGKVFIEYLPAELAWRPISAPNYFFIHCLWVSGRYQKHGWGPKLLEACIEDARQSGKAGVAVVASKKPFLTDPRFFQHHGFEKVDEAPPFFELLALKLKDGAATPAFLPNAKALTIPQKEGVVVYYTDQCPFTDFYVQEMIAVAKEKGLKTAAIHITSAEEAQQLPTAFGTFNVFLNGSFLTHVVHTRKQFVKLLEKEL
jgi:ribosomal protein S18 acetylase RimI-like enzyme